MITFPTNVDAIVDGRWYLLIGEGGTERGHCLTIATSDGVTWVDGWPVVDEDRYAVVEQTEEVVEDFADEALDPAWVSPTCLPSEFAEIHSDGGLTISGDSEPRLLCRRVRHRDWSAEVAVAPGSAAARLVIQIDRNHRYCVEASSGSARGVARVGTIEQIFGPVAVDAGELTLVVGVSTSVVASGVFGKPPDTVQLGVRRGDVTEVLTELDGRYLSTDVAGGFTGRLSASRPRPDRSGSAGFATADFLRAERIQA